MFNTWDQVGISAPLADKAQWHVPIKDCANHCSWLIILIIIKKLLLNIQTNERIVLPDTDRRLNHAGGAVSQKLK